MLIQDSINLKNKFIDYFFLIGWLFKDLYKKFNKQLIFSLFSNLIGNSINILGFVIVIQYFKILTTDEFPEILRNISIIDKENLIYFFVPSVLLIFSLSSYLPYLSRKVANNIEIVYDKICFERIINILSATNSKDRIDELIPICSSTCRQMGSSARLVFFSLGHITIIPILYFFLIYLSPSLTFLVSIIFLFVIFFFYKFSIEASANKKKLLDNATKSRQERIHMIARALSGFGKVNENDIQFDTIFSKGANHIFGQALENQKNVLEKGALVTKIITGFVLCSLMFFFHYDPIGLISEIEIIITFVVTLQILTGKVVQVSRMLLGFNRLYSDLNSYKNYIYTRKKIFFNNVKNLINLDKDKSYGIFVNLPVLKNEVAKILEFFSYLDNYINFKILNPIEITTNTTLKKYFDIDDFNDENFYEYLKRNKLDLNLYSKIKKNNRKELLELNKFEIIIFSLYSLEMNKMNICIINIDLLIDLEKKYYEISTSLINKSKTKFLYALDKKEKIENLPIDMILGNYKGKIEQKDIHNNIDGFILPNQSNETKKGYSNDDFMIEEQMI